MAEIKSFPNNQDVYVGAEWVMKWLHGRTSGVFGAEGNLAMTVVPDSMSIQISDGIGWMSNANGDGIVFWNDSEQTNGSKLTLTHDIADGVLDRIDRIVVTWETTNYVALPTISVLKGTASSVPVPPSLTNNNIQRQISLAKVNIPAGTVSLSASMITDERLDSSVCGIVTETVQADTTMVNAQIRELIDQLEYSLGQVVSGGVPAHASTHASDGADPINPEDIGAAPASHAHSAADLTSGTLPVARGGTGAETASAAMSAISLITNKGYWNQALTGISAWKYEGADTTAYSLPYPHCYVLVMKESGSTGVAIAFRWNDGYNVTTWINHLHSTWRGWKLAVQATTHIQSGTPSNPVSGDLWAW